MIFALVNESTHPGLSRPLLLSWAEAFAMQVATDFASMWQTLPVDVLVVDTLSEVPHDACIVHFVDRIPEAPDALAYHMRDTKNRPVARIGVYTSLDNGGTLDDVSESASHEILEAWEDPYCTEWIEYDGDKYVADEVCDPVQGTPYKIKDVTVANFVGSRWRDLGGEGPFDFCRKLQHPLSRLPTGYLAFSDGSQDLGEEMPVHKRTQAMLYGRRASK